MFRILLDVCPNPALHEPYATKAFIAWCKWFLDLQLYVVITGFWYCDPLDILVFY
jgi:hypothetical protein